MNKIGKGRSNTITISDNSLNSAARIVLNQQINGTLGWFIPSLDELNILFKSKNLTLNFEEGYYWSSSEYDAYLAYDYLIIRLNCIMMLLPLLNGKITGNNCSENSVYRVSELAMFGLFAIRVFLNIGFDIF